MQSKPRVRQEKLRTSLSFGDLSNTYHLPFERRARTHKHTHSHAYTRVVYNLRLNRCFVRVQQSGRLGIKPFKGWEEREVGRRGKMGGGHRGRPLSRAPAHYLSSRTVSSPITC